MLNSPVKAVMGQRQAISKLLTFGGTSTAPGGGTQLPDLKRLIDSARISALLLWLLFLVPVDAQNSNHSDEVQFLRSFVLASLEMPGSSVPGGGLGLSSSVWSWNFSDENACTWVGVSCTSNFTVESIDLSGWGPSTVSGLAYLSYLPDLRELDLSSNNFGPRFPSKIANFTGLTRLDLSSNLLQELPVNITFCRELRSLFLQNNDLFDLSTIDLSNFEKLQVLSLANNILINSPGTLEQIGELSNLISLDLSQNQLVGNISSLSKLTKLLELKLDYNPIQLSSYSPQIRLPASLRLLTISNSQSSGPLPDAIKTLVGLEVLNMSNNHLDGVIPDWLGTHFASQSFQLDLSSNAFTGPIPAALLQPSGQVASLNLSCNNLSGSIPLSLDGGQEGFLYDVLDLSHNQLTGPIPFVKKNQTTKISSLWLQNNQLTGDIVELFVNGNQSGLSETIDLRLQSNRFTGDLSRMANMWSNWSQLKYIDLSNNSLEMTTTEAIPDPLGLTLENLAQNGLLKEFRVGGNDFSGTSLPTGSFLGPLIPGSDTPIPTPLEVLDLSGCHLLGKISGAVFNDSWFSNLRTLNFSNNELTGPVLESVVTISEFVALDVSNNHLSGNLPEISHTSRSYNPSYFTGNALCGDPLPPCLGSRLRWWLYLIIVLSVLVAMGSFLAAIWQWRVYRERHQQDADLIKTLIAKESATLMTLGELKKATNNFSENAKIGEGGFGDVYKGDLNNGTKVAIKRSKREGSDKDKKQFLNEVRILSSVNHRNLVKLLGCCMENKVALLVFEFVSNGTLQQHLGGEMDSGETRLSWKQRLNIAVQIADALNYLHSGATFPIYHRDVKSANILLTDGLNAKVADFGISKLAPLEATHVSTIGVHGTMGYIDPEYYTTFQLTSKSDVYGFGVVLLELISAKPPIDSKRGENETSLVHFGKPLIGNGDLQRFLDPTLMEAYSDPSMKESMLKVGRLAMECLDMRSKARPSMYEVWMELRNLWHEVDGTSGYFNCIKEDNNENLQQDSVFLLSERDSISSSRVDLSTVDEVNCTTTLEFPPCSEIELL